MAQHRPSWTETKLELTRTTRRGSHVRDPTTLSTKYPPSSEIFRAGRSQTQRFLEGLYDGTRERAQLTHTKIAHRLDKLSVGKFTIDPLASRAMHQWDVTVSLALVYTVLVPPAEIAFARRINAGSATGDRWGLFLLSLGNLFVWSVFIFDVILQFFTHVQLPESQGGFWIRNHRGITRHYLRTAFALDFVSIVPFGYLSLLAGPYTAGREVRALKLLRLLRLTKLLRMYRTSRLLLRYRSDNTMSIGMSNIASVICGFVIASHWLACLWGYVGNNSAPIENTWMAAYLDGGDAGPDRGGWNIRDPKFQYLMSLYFTLTTLTTVGYGDVLPKNVAERSVATLMILFGGMLWSLIIAAITQTVATLDSDHITYNQRYDQINRMLVDLQVCTPLRREAREYLLGSANVQRREHYGDLVELLSPGLQESVAENVFVVLLNVVPYFTKLDAIVKLEIFKTLGHLLFAPEEIVNVQKTLMIITNHGFIGTKGRLKMIGDALFLDFLVSDDEPPPMAVVLKFCEVATIRRADIFDVCARHPAATTPLLYARVFWALVKLGRDVRAARVERRAHHEERASLATVYKRNRDLVDALTSGGDEAKKRGSVYAAAPLPPGSPLRPPPPRGSPLAAPRPPPPADAPAVAPAADAERDLLARLEEADAAAARLGAGSAAGDAWRARRDRLARDLEDLQGDLGAPPRRRRGSQRAALLAELAADDSEDPDCGSGLCLA